MATTEALTENSRQGINLKIPPCIGLEGELSRNLRPGCGHAYDETAAGIVVYVRNDPVNRIDLDGRDDEYVSVSISYEEVTAGLVGGTLGKTTWMVVTTTYYFDIYGWNPAAEGEGPFGYVGGGVDEPQGGAGGPLPSPRSVNPFKGFLVGANVTSDQQSQFYNAFNLALSLLTGDCAKFLGSKGIDPTKALNATTFFYLPLTALNGTQADVNPFTQQVSINAYGDFFNPTNANGQDLTQLFGGNNPLAFQAFVILRELGHITGALLDDGQYDPNHDDNEKANNKAIFENCFSH